MQRQQVQKLRTKEIREKAQENERDHWFNQERPTREPAKTRKEKRIEREGRSEESGDDEGNTKEVGTMSMEVNMAFHLPDKFGLPETELVQLNLGAERAIFEKPEEVGSHMKPLYIKGYLDGEPVGRMLVDGGACVNIMPCFVFERLGHQEKELMRTNMTLSGFSGEVSDTKGIISKELTVGNKTIPTAFCVVDIKGKYNVLLGWDWIHANGCVPSTLHQCVMRWVGNNIEVIEADDSVCVAMAEPQENLPEGKVKCLTGRDLSGYDYISIGQEGFVPVNIKPTAISRLESLEITK
jgi:hypothetical protein